MEIPLQKNSPPTIIDHAAILDCLETNVKVLEQVSQHSPIPMIQMIVLTTLLMNRCAILKMKAEVNGTGTDARTTH